MAVPREIPLQVPRSDQLSTEFGSAGMREIVGRHIGRLRRVDLDSRRKRSSAQFFIRVYSVNRPQSPSEDGRRLRKGPQPETMVERPGLNGRTSAVHYLPPLTSASDPKRTFCSGNRTAPRASARTSRLDAQGTQGMTHLKFLSEGNAPLALIRRLI